MKKNVYVSVSLDPIKEYSKIVDYAKSLQGKADMLHCDIMDGEFVQRETFDWKLLNNINQNTLSMLDVHLMCSEPLDLIESYLKAGANIITVHYEAFDDKNNIINACKMVKKANALFGLSIKPNTEIKDIKLYLHNIDLVLVMSVEPGLSGQKFMPSSLEKIKELDKIRQENNFNFKIEVDGGINGENAKEIIDVGADILVSGSYIYTAQSPISAINSLKL